MEQSIVAGVGLSFGSRAKGLVKGGILGVCVLSTDGLLGDEQPHVV